MAGAYMTNDGWLAVPYDGPELAAIEIGVNGDWRPAFLGFGDDGRRVAKIRHTSAQGRIEVRFTLTSIPVKAPQPGTPGSATSSSSVS